MPGVAGIDEHGAPGRQGAISFGKPREFSGEIRHSSRPFTKRMDCNSLTLKGCCELRAAYSQHAHF